MRPLKDMFSRFITSKLAYINLESHIQILTWLRKLFSLSLCQGHLKSRLFYKIKIWNLYRLNDLFGSFITHDIVIGEDQSKNRRDCIWSNFISEEESDDMIWYHLPRTWDVSSTKGQMWRKEDLATIREIN